MEWQDRLIKTNVDKLLTYIAEHREAPVSQIADDLEATDDMVEVWASSLNDAGLIDKEYSARHGTLLKANIEAIREKMDQFRESTHTEVSKAETAIPHHEKIEDTKTKLSTLIDAIEQQKKATKQIEDTIQSIEENEEEISGITTPDIHTDITAILEEIEHRVGSIDNLEDEIQTFKKRKKNIKANIKALNILEKAYRKAKEPENVEKVSQMSKEQQKDHKDEEATCHICNKTFKNKLGVKVHQSKMHSQEEIENARKNTDHTSSSVIDWITAPFS